MQPPRRVRRSSPLSLSGSWWRSSRGAVLVVLGLMACGKQDPLTRVLRERQGLEVELLSWAPSGDRIHVELRVRGRPRLLSRLTVLVTQYDREEESIRLDRMPLDLEGIRQSGSKQMFVSVPAAGSPVESLSVDVEIRPPEEAMGEFPELEPYL